MPNASYDPRNWFWVVGGDTSRFWSSTGVYVKELPPGFYPSVQAAVDADSDAGVRAQPTIDVLIAELPAMVWPA